MKRSIMLISLLLAAMLLVGTGCRGGGSMTPTPSATMKPTVTASPKLTASIAPVTTTPPAASPTGGTSASPSGTGGTIQGFKEGEKVDVANLPTAVKDAIAEKYPGATIKEVTYATYSNKQMYLITLSGAADKTEKVYASADGTLTPYSS